MYRSAVRPQTIDQIIEYLQESRQGRTNKQILQAIQEMLGFKRAQEKDMYRYTQRQDGSGIVKTVKSDTGAFLTKNLMRNLASLIENAEIIFDDLNDGEDLDLALVRDFKKNCTNCIQQLNEIQ